MFNNGTTEILKNVSKLIHLESPLGHPYLKWTGAPQIIGTERKTVRLVKTKAILLFYFPHKLSKENIFRAS